MHIDAFLAEFSTFFIGITIVFVTLIILIFLMNLLSKMIGALERKSKFTTKDIPDVSQPVKEELTTVIEEPIALIDELELVAVITAAIAASMGTTSDKLQVRSLRQVTRQIR